MRRVLLALVAYFFLLPAHAYLSDEDRYFYLRPLLGKHDMELYAGAFIIEKSNVKDIEVLDVVAEQLSRNVDKAKNKVFLQFNAVHRMIYILGDSGSARYRPFLKSLSQRDLSEHTQRLLEKSLEKVPAASSGEAFEPGKLDLAAVQASLDALYAKGKKDAPVEFTIPADSSPAEVFRKLGYPDAISVGVGMTVLFGVDLVYYDRGSIRLRNTRTTEFKVNNVLKVVRHPPIDTTQPGAVMAHRLMLDGARLFHGAGHFVNELPAPDRIILDAAADRLWLLLDSSESEVAEGALFLCQAFKKADDPRYRPVLRDIADRSKFGFKTRDTARAVLRGFGDKPADEYQRREIPATPRT